MLAETRQGAYYFKQGMELTLRAPWFFASIVFLFSVPALLAAFVSWRAEPQILSAAYVIFLNTITTVVGAMVFMIAVGANYRDEQVTFPQIVRRALPWLPRYIWTNVHTSIIFWVPVSSLIVLHSWLSNQGWLGTIPSWFDVWGFTILVGVVAGYMHSRTLLAPFLAVHSDLPASRAAWESWRLSGYTQKKVLMTFFVGSLPFAIPVLVLFRGMLLGEGYKIVPANVEPHLMAVGLQFVRLTLIPSAYVLYHEIWDAEETRWQMRGAPPAPALVAMLLKLTAWLPVLGPFGQRDPSKAFVTSAPLTLLKTGRPLGRPRSL